MSALSVAALVLLLAAVPAVAGTLAVDFSASANNFGETNEWNLGFEFQVNNPVTVLALGAYNSPDAGWGGTQNVGLWNSSGVLLASVEVTNSDTAIGNWYFNSITPIVLVAGQDYIVGAQGGTNFAGDVPVTVDPDITYLDDEYFYFDDASPLTPLTEPTSTEGYSSPSAAGWFGGNLEFGSASASAPEPGTFILLAAGFLGLGIHRKRK
jgi:hypothetical protein